MICAPLVDSLHDHFLQVKAEDVADEGPLHEDNEWGITLEEEYVPQESSDKRQVAEGVQVNTAMSHNFEHMSLSSVERFSTRRFQGQLDLVCGRLSCYYYYSVLL